LENKGCKEERDDMKKKRGEAFLMMWLKRLSTLNPPLIVASIETQ